MDVWEKNKIICYETKIKLHSNWIPKMYVFIRSVLWLSNTKDKTLRMPGVLRFLSNTFYMRMLSVVGEFLLNWNLVIELVAKEFFLMSRLSFVIENWPEIRSFIHNAWFMNWKQFTSLTSLRIIPTFHWRRSYTTWTGISIEMILFVKTDYVNVLLREDRTWMSIYSAFM